MAQITGIEPISMVLETTVLPLNYICITGALDGIRTHTPKALPPEDSASTYFTTRALKMAGTSGFEPEHAGVKVLCLTIWLHPNVKKTCRNGQAFLLCDCHYLSSKQVEEHLSQEMFRNARAFHTFFLGVSQVPEPRKVWCHK